ncbi:MAG: hypothetical protein HYX95_02560 [Chloroflexi bacterium]|nr:hypothetical protein [Chloroflexota bacterium]
MARPSFGAVGLDQLPVYVVPLSLAAAASPEVHAQIIALPAKPGVYTTSPFDPLSFLQSVLATNAANVEGLSEKIFACPTAEVRLEEHVVTPHGLGDDPLSDKELEDKFSEMAAKRMKARQVRRILDTIWSAERVDDMGRLMDLMVFPSR